MGQDLLHAGPPRAHEGRTAPVAAALRQLARERIRSGEAAPPSRGDDSRRQRSGSSAPAVGEEDNQSADRADPARLQVGNRAAARFGDDSPGALNTRAAEAGPVGRQGNREDRSGAATRNRRGTAVAPSDASSAGRPATSDRRTTRRTPSSPAVRRGNGRDRWCLEHPAAEPQERLPRQGARDLPRPQGAGDASSLPESLDDNILLLPHRSRSASLQWSAYGMPAPPQFARLSR